MKLSRIIENIKSIFSLGNRVLFQKESEVIDLNFEKLNIKESRVTKFRDYLVQISNGNVKIFDVNLNILLTYFDNRITRSNCYFEILTNENFALILAKNDSLKESLTLVYNGSSIYEDYEFFGCVLNQYFRLNYHENTFGNPRHFRCSDLLDEKTYWEYTCPTGLQASNTWVVRGEYLLFCENTDGSYQGNIKKIHLPTGELKWEAAVPMTRLHYNESQGLFISFWANVDYGQYYQIIDIDNETLEFGNPITDVILQNLPSTEGTLYLYERKLYFTDFSNVYGDQIPKIMFGCFDIDTKEVEFLQEVPEAKGDGFAQVIYSDNKLYLRSFGNKLYVYEHEITAS